MSRNAATTLTLLTLFCAVAGADAASSPPPPPPEFIPPLHPGGVQLVPKELATGVYALLSTRPPVDNSGFVVGERGVLVIDAHINGEMARAIQAAVRQTTSKPILYVVNTNFHGDHTFGNYAFPAETHIVAHRSTAERMRDFDGEKAQILHAVAKDPAVLAGVELRLPDLVFDDTLRLDLGGRSVELYHFGFGNTAGDTVVWVPEAKTAWTGNLVLGGGMPPYLLEGHPREFIDTLATFARTLDARTIVPGHGPITSGAALARSLDYLVTLLQSVEASLAAGRGLEETLASSPLADRFIPPLGEQASRLLPFYTGMHSENVRNVFQDLSAATR